MIRTGRDADKDALMRLWEVCFPRDTRPFVRFYFDRVYAGDQTLIWEEDGRPVASLQMIPYRIKSGVSLLWGGYISGAMTHPGHRGKGYMAQLLTASFDHMREKGYAFTFLIPQQEHLAGYYAKFGYERAFPEHSARYHCKAECPVKRPAGCPTAGRKPGGEADVHTGLSTIDLPSLYAAYSGYLMEKANAVLKSEAQFSDILWDLFDEGGVLFASDRGLAFAHKKRDTAVLAEFFYRDGEARTDILQTVCAYYSVTEVVIRDDPSAPITGYKGMIKSLDSSAAVKTDIYMGQMLD